MIKNWGRKFFFCGEILIWPDDRLTRFEVARLVGARSLQISLGAPVLIKKKDIVDPIQLAKLEFRSRIIPITIKRKIPSGGESIIDVKRAIKNWLDDHSGEI